MNREVFSRIPRSLLCWFDKNKRNLPWRRSRDPYKIWVSEIMLQQTQVDTVIPYYQRWMRRFPDLESLASASLPQVLKAWEGLGYYARARNLHKTARIIAKKQGGKFPDSAEELMKLPGIGRYTAGAIASIAFNQPEPVLDGNVKRVLSRVFALRIPIDTSRGEEKLWQISRNLVVDVEKRKRGLSPLLGTVPFSFGDLNQALMELGALVCVPEGPRCNVCPLSRLCKAHSLGKELTFPRRLRREKIEPLKTAAAIIRRNGKVLLQKQPKEGRWGGLWMFPQWVIRNGKNERQLLKDNLRKEFGLEARHLIPRFTVKHGFTKYRIRLRVYEGKSTLPTSVIASAMFGKSIRHAERSEASRKSGILRPSGPQNDGVEIPHEFIEHSTRNSVRQTTRRAITKWVLPSQLARLPLPAPHQKIAKAVLESHV